MDDHSPRRRARLRAETTDEIKRIALDLMSKGGPDAISLRAIAREMGMTAGAIYGYFETRDALVTTLIDDIYSAQVAALEAARDAAPADPAARLFAWGQAFREWALANPQGFRLIYGDPVHGYQPPEGGPAAEAENRACAGLTGLVAAAWPEAEATQANREHQWTEFDEHLVTQARRSFPQLPPAGVALSLRVWGRMHGLVSLEVYGHLRTQSRDPGRLYRDELLDLVRSLGLDASSV